MKEEKRIIVAGTGHRPNKLGGYSDEVYNKLVDLAYNELMLIQPDIVISGMALGWDQALTEAAINRNIPLWAYVPFLGQEDLWPEQSKVRYKGLLDRAEKVKVISEPGYTAYKMQLRNEAMVKDCTILLALWNGSPGGLGTVWITLR